MKVLVTGATGFLGSAVARALTAAGQKVRALVRPDSRLDNLADLKVERVSGDLLDKESLRSALAGCTRLYHVAAHFAFWAPDPSLFYKTNIIGTRNLLEVAQELALERIVYTSTVSTIGVSSGGALATEQTPVSLQQMTGHYRRSKYLAEQEVLRLARVGVPVVIVNPSAPVGEGDIKPTPTGQMIVDYLKGRMWAYLAIMLNLIDREDVAVGHLLAMERGHVGERYILANRNLWLREIFEILSRCTGIRAHRIELPWQAVSPLAYVDQWLADYVTHQPPHIPLDAVWMAKTPVCYDNRKAVHELGLPQSPIEVALEKAVKWFRQYGYA